MPEPSSPSDIRASLIKYAAFCLNRQPYFYSRLQTKLMMRAKKLGFHDADAIITAILDDLKKSGYLNDVYLAGSFVRGQLQKGYGPRLIKLKLRQIVGMDGKRDQRRGEYPVSFETLPRR